MRRILISIMAIVAMSWAVCQPGQIQLNGSGACVTDCGKYLESSKVKFRNCSINQLGTPAIGYYDYYLRLPADTPQKRFAQSINDCLEKGIGCSGKKQKTQQKKRQRSRTHGNGVTSTK